MTVQRWIPDISKDVETQFSKVNNKCVHFSLAADETTDITSTVQICIFAHSVSSDFQVFEGLHSMQGHTKGLDFIQALLCSLQKHNFELSKFVGTVTDATPFMIGSNNGMVSLLCKHLQDSDLQKELIQYHCIIHQQNLIGKVLGDVVSAVNVIKSRGLNHRLFKTFLDKIKSEYGNIVILCTTLKFTGLVKARFCNVFYHY
jgi:hypothetical protein